VVSASPTLAPRPTYARTTRRWRRAGPVADPVAGLDRLARLAPVAPLRVSVRVLHPDPGPSAGPLERYLDRARRENGERHVRGFRAAGADDVALLAGPPDDTSFGARLDGLRASLPAGNGIVVLGSGSMPLAGRADRSAFVGVARGVSGPRAALANNRYSADAVAIASPADLPPIPDLPGDNALPRWLAERAGWAVSDLHRRWRLQVDLDSPLDIALARAGGAGGERDGHATAEPDTHLLGAVVDRLAAVRALGAYRHGELLVSGRTSAASLHWLEVHTACRIRALVEERGLRASSVLAVGDEAAGAGSPGPRRPPRSVLGDLLDRDGPEALGPLVSELADGALIDSRVLLAHRLGVDERSWPSAEDRFASDLLRWEEIADPWLRALTHSAAGSSIPIVLGGHTLVGPGIRLAIRA